MMFEQPRPHHRMADHVLHRDGTHCAIVEVDVRYEPWRQLAQDGQDLSLDATAIGRKVHVLRDAQFHTRLLDNDGLACLRITDPEDIVEVAIADLLRGQDSIIGKEIRQFRADIRGHIFCLHQEILAVIRHDENLLK